MGVSAGSAVGSATVVSVDSTEVVSVAVAEVVSVLAVSLLVVSLLPHAVSHFLETVAFEHMGSKHPYGYRNGCRVLGTCGSAWSP